MSLKPLSEGRYDYIALVPLDVRPPERHARKFTPKLSLDSRSWLITARRRRLDVDNTRQRDRLGGRFRFRLKAGAVVELERRVRQPVLLRDAGGARDALVRYRRPVSQPNPLVGPGDRLPLAMLETLVLPKAV